VSDTLTLDPVPQAARATGNGFKCLACGFADTAVKDTRPTNFGPHRVIRRRRHCARCKGRCTTVEIELGALEGIAGANPGMAATALQAAMLAVRRAADLLNVTLPVRDKQRDVRLAEDAEPHGHAVRDNHQ
jgi:hypothetical protein